MTRLTKRGRIVLIYIPAGVALLALLVWISGNVWYVEGKGYCKGTMTECFEAFTR